MVSFPNAIPLAFLLVSACASATVAYRPASSASDFGYRDQRIEDGRFRVSFTGRDGARAADGALLRAAEVTLDAGGDWFRVVSRDITTETEGSGSRSSIGIGGGTGRRSGVGVGVGVNVPLAGGNDSRTLVSLEILIGTGPEPDGDDYYLASAIVTNLQPF